MPNVFFLNTTEGKMAVISYFHHLANEIQIQRYSRQGREETFPPPVFVSLDGSFPGSLVLRKELNGQRKGGTSQVQCGQVGTLPRELS